MSLHEWTVLGVIPNMKLLPVGTQHSHTCGLSITRTYDDGTTATAHHSAHNRTKFFNAIACRVDGRSQDRGGNPTGTDA